MKIYRKWEMEPYGMSTSKAVRQEQHMDMGVGLRVVVSGRGSQKKNPKATWWEPLGVAVRLWIFTLHKMRYNWRIPYREMSLRNTFKFLNISIFFKLLSWINFRFRRITKKKYREFP